ncbi:hypothetical protein [Dyadobacter luticola]|uniref:Uncharacterized protein n=1 Tax=Dyadobacter luticola TaxID=1979387 RepID=A0A5R9L1D9_9BACT|nr:hypothetical protein [Dyadobacter luticola]TLV02165.1 hypothetical protein FEN17_00545 [Dyadobacter luticola]
MNALTHFRKEIKAYFPESSELILSESFATHPRFNFYFEIKPGERFLLYLNSDGDDLGYTLKCLEFRDSDVLKRLINSYPTIGSKAFNIGQPRTRISFIYRAENRISVTQTGGDIHDDFNWHEISASHLLQGLDPLIKN